MKHLFARLRAGRSAAARCAPRSAVEEFIAVGAASCNRAHRVACRVRCPAAHRSCRTLQQDGVTLIARICDLRGANVRGVPLPRACKRATTHIRACCVGIVSVENFAVGQEPRCRRSHAGGGKKVRGTGRGASHLRRCIVAVDVVADPLALSPDPPKVIRSGIVLNLDSPGPLSAS